MLENHFLIGLGGTGGKILRSFRKTIYQNVQRENPEGVNLAYLYVDSSESLMSLDDQNWKILGKSLQLTQSSQLKITGLNLTEVLDNVNNYPGIAPWIGDRDSFRQILKGADATTVLGGQKRRLGRFLFACKSGEYRTRVQSIVKDLVVGNKTTVTFHFLVGLAGGTGSGCLIDAICQTRAMFPSRDNRIIVYALLPDKNPRPERAGPNYHANGYAALLELNALDVGAYMPYNVAAKQTERLDLLDAFNLCYLFTDENEDRNAVDIDRELPDIVGSFLFQKIVNTKDLIWTSSDGDSIKRQERFELGPQAEQKETSPASGRPERTRRFFTFGTKQIAYPEEEILEFLTYTFAQQAALQLQFNNFSESAGYLDQPTNQSFGEQVRSPELLRRWLLSGANLMLSEGILPDERSNKKWKPIAKFWEDLTPSLKEHVREMYAKDRAAWVSELKIGFSAQYDHNYRDLGVRRFYEIKRGESRDYCREIRRVIETDLFEEWANGTKSLFDISRLLQALTGALGDHRGDIDIALTKNIDDEKAATAQVDQYTAKWSSISALGRVFGKEVGIFEQLAEALRQQYVARTTGEGLRFARPLLDAVIAEITDLANEVARASSTVNNSATMFSSAVAGQLSDQGKSNLQGQVVRFYDPNTVKDFARILVRNGAQQKLQTAAARLAISSALGETRSFATFNGRIKEQAFRDLVEQTSEECVRQAHDAIISADSIKDRVLGVSVLERLEKEYGGNRDLLRLYITEIVSRAKNQLVFNPAEVQKTVPGNTSLEGMFSQGTTIIPEDKDQGSFRQTLVNEFKSAKSGVEIASNPQRPNEITLINVTSAFPARFVQDVQFLKDRYDARVGSSDGARARAELHTEGDGKTFPSLFLRVITQKDVLPIILIAKAMGKVGMFEDETGETAAYLVSKDAAGRNEDPVRLGKDLTEASDSIDAISFDKLETSVKGELATTYKHRADRATLYSAVRSAVEEVTTAINNPVHSISKAYVQADRTAESLLGLAGS